jgi:hypothetical protein
MRFITFVGTRSAIQSFVAMAAVGVATLSSALCMAAANNLLINATASTNNINGTIGYQFAADAEADYPRVAKALGFIDAGEDGLASSHQVGLYHWNGSAYTLERSVTIGSGTAYYLNGGYRWYPITDYSLTDTGSTAYLLAATVASGDGDLWGGNGSADFTSIGNATYNINPASTGGSLTSSLLPATWDGTFPGGTFYNAANLTVNPAVPLPEPSTYAMALAGLACGGYLVRRRRKRA